MPIGIEPPGLKTSISLSSLPPGTPSDSPEHARLRVRTDRPYHSLTKQNRRAEQTASWRKSWGSGISSDDREYWDAFQADYDYLMSQSMVPQSVASTPTATPHAPPVWSLQECLDRFAQLFSWLKRVQDSVYAKGECATDWTLRAAGLEELQKQRWRLDEFNDGTSELVRQCPHMEEEMVWRVRHINASWQSVETLMAPPAGAGGQVEHEVRCLRKWLRGMESKLEPLSFNNAWSYSELEKRLREHSVVQRDIESHRRVVTSVVRSCGRSDKPEHRRDSSALERQYHNLLLRAIEWQCYIESLLARHSNKSPACEASESDGEPVAKYPRYSQENYSTEKASVHVLHDYTQQVADVVMDTVSPLQAAPGPSPVVLRRDARLWTQTRSYSPTRRRGVADFTGSISSDETTASGVSNASGVVCGSHAQAVTKEPTTARPRSNIGNIEIRHEDTDSELERKVNGSKFEEEGQSTESEGWSYERRQKAVRCLQFKDSPKMKARTMSVQELVEGAENLLRKSRKPIESRDASGEGTSESDSCESPPRTPKLRPARPLSLSCFAELHPQSDSRQWSASETSLNNMSTVKKRRLRPKRKFGSLRKMDCAASSPAGGSDRPLSWAEDCPSALVKSESFSGMDRRERTTPSQSPVKCSMPDSGGRRGSSESYSSPSEATLQRGEDSEEESPAPPALSFKLGPDAGVVTASATESEKLGGEEPSSLNTEDCWDDYQEKYPSEQYSEEAEDGKQVLNFGDDYRKFLDSPSDTLRAPRRRRLRQFRAARIDSTESESEPEELRSLLDRSMSQLREVETLIHTGGLHVNYDELFKKCRENIKCLKTCLEAATDAKPFLVSKSIKKIKDVIDQWIVAQNMLEGQSDLVRKPLEQKIQMLTGELCLLACDESEKPRLKSKEELAKKIVRAKSDLDAIRGRKSLLRELSSTVHHVTCVSAEHSHGLKAQVYDLYLLWEATFESVSDQLCLLQSAETHWLEVEDQLQILTNSLRADRDTLGMLDCALHSDESSIDLPDSARDLAKLLSEKDCTTKCRQLSDDACFLLTEGSLSDSGISDSGSELELGERVKRLDSLKRLAQRLEAFLDPGSQALRNMTQRIDEAELELRALQQTCRELFTKSATVSEDVQLAARVTGKYENSPQISKSVDADQEPIGGSPWFWRVIRSALPFQLALVALLCVACLLEPQCCDAMNNLGLSHTSQFRYFSGPPPV